jgi:nitrogenase molybdenum-iron protein NifN
MARVKRPEKSCAVNPLKMSQPVGAAMAFLGVRGAAPLLLGSRGCATVGLVFLVRHFQEPISFETVAMDEVSAVLGGTDELEKALLALHDCHAPDLVGLISTGLSETRGDDVVGALRLIRGKHEHSRPDFAAMETVCVSAPDFTGAYQDGWGAATLAMAESLVQPKGEKDGKRINVLAGQHLTPGDVEEIKDTLECFGLKHTVLPDISGPLGGLDSGLERPAGPGTSLEDIRAMGTSAFTIAVGEHMRPAAQSLERLARVPFRVFESLTGLGPCDEFTTLLAQLSGVDVPARFRRQRARLLDAMLCAQGCFAGRRAAVALDPDQLFAHCALLTGMGAGVCQAVASAASPILEKIPVSEVLIGDLEDLETGAVGADLIIAPSSARGVAARLGVPLLRAGLPVSDRLGAGHKVSVGYRGTRELIFEMANFFLRDQDEPGHGLIPA